MWDELDEGLEVGRGVVGVVCGQRVKGLEAEVEVGEDVVVDGIVGRCLGNKPAKLVSHKSTKKTFHRLRELCLV